MKSISKFIVGLVVLSAFFSCNKGSDNNNSQTRVNQTSTGYVWNGYTCVQTSTGQQVPSNLCANSTNNGSVTLMSCYGSYMLNGQIYQCGISSNCSGFLMTNYQTGQVVQCQ